MPNINQRVNGRAYRYVYGNCNKSLGDFVNTVSLFISFFTSIRAPNSSSGASVHRSVGSNPGRDTCVPEQDT